METLTIAIPIQSLKSMEILQWYGQMTPWCFFLFREMAFKVLGGDLAKKLLGVGGSGKRLLGAD